jgi:hypothetical protein
MKDSIGVPILRMGITIGINATTRLSTAAVVHVVQPRFDAPEYQPVIREK